MISIKQIQNFLVLAQVLHFAKAAAQLNISQATLSNEIKKMEKTLGFQLFDRSDKWEIKLTYAGKSYYDCIKNIPATIHKAQQEASQSARGEQGILTIAASNIAYDYINLGDIIKKMTRTYPKIKLKIFDMPNSVNRFDCLSYGKADLAIFAGDNDIAMPEGFKTKILLPLQVSLAVHRKSRLAENKNLTIRDLKNIPLILPPREDTPNLRQKWDEIFITHCNSLPTVTHEVVGFRGILQFVAAGMGTGLVFTRKENTVVDDVLFLKLPVNLNRSLLIGFRETPTPVAKKFLDFIEGCIR